MFDLKKCQSAVHDWGVKNRVSFDASKEEFRIIPRKHSFGPPFRLLGPTIDTKLIMHAAIDKVVSKAKPKLKALLRCKPFYQISDIIRQYKTHLLPLLESITAAVYHASNTQLRKLDNLQRSFAHHLNISDETLFLNYNLAPLCLRRDVAMVGLLYKCAYGRAHGDLQKLWPLKTVEDHSHAYETRYQDLRHDRQLRERMYAPRSDQMKNSVFGLVKIFNVLDQKCVDEKNVSLFQRALIEKARSACRSESAGWRTMFSPR